MRFRPYDWLTLPDSLQSCLPAPAPKVARRLTGLSPGQFEIETSIIAAQRVSGRCYLHQVLPSGSFRAGERPLASFVEKRARRKECRVYTRLADQFDRTHPPLAPRLYFARMHRRSATLFLEYLPRVGKPPERSQENAIRLADRIFDITELSPADYSRFHVVRDLTDPTLFDAFLASAEAEDRIGGRAMRSRVKEFSGSFAEHKKTLIKVPCHNDLHWHNISSVISRRDEIAFRFIDWQLFSLNFLGADLHFLARNALARPAEDVFWQALLARYTERAREKFSVDETSVALGAYGYALCRSLHIVEHGDSPQPPVETLLEKMEQLMAKRPS